MNFDASANGTVDFTTTTNTGVETFNNYALSGSGENFFTFTTLHGQRYTSISFVSDAPVNFVDAAQFRIGGAQRNTVPDGGTTVAMLGMGLVGLFGLRRRFGA